MRKDTYRVPTNDEEALIEPPLEDLPGIVERNSQLLRNVDIRVNGQPFQGLRSQTRDAAIHAAIHSDIGGGDQEFNTDAPIVMTGRPSCRCHRRHRHEHGRRQ